MADVTGGDAAEREAPRTLLGRLGVVGPGIVVAVTGVEAGDMVTSLVELAKALDRLRHEPPLQGGGEARPERLWTGLKPKARLDGRTLRFFSQRVVPR